MNHLASENSPYLLQHAGNPVDWYPWGPEALEKARAEDKPIFLSIGYAACHWCHVMAHESFEDPQTAGLMNQFFVNIKVDREERPDLDGIYMDAVVAMTGQGGWPMSVFLTPDGRPFFGGTYFPPVRRYRMPSFQEVLATVARLWKEDRAQLLGSANEIITHLQQGRQSLPAGPALDPRLLDQAAFRLAQAYDWQHGGWGPAPRFPQPMAIEFLLRRAARGDQLALDVAIHCLERMALGGMYDVVGGGFARYSTDDDWLVPHFEKMLYDNAQLARVYLWAHLLTGRGDFRRVCEETLDFMARELRHPDGGFYSSLDADSEGEEGKFYLWSAGELKAILAAAGQEAPAALPVVDWVDFFFTAYGVTPTGNFEGRSILQRQQDDASLGQRFGLSPGQVVELLDYMHQALLRQRAARVRPATDDKVLTAWNGLALTAFAEAARYLHRPDYLDLARRNADFLLTALQVEGRLLRSWRAGNAGCSAYLEDYASLGLGLLALYQSDPDARWYAQAEALAGQVLAHFRDPAGPGFYDTSDDHEPLVVRPRDVQDNATPSGSALAVQLLLSLSAYTANGDWHDQAEAALTALQQTTVRYPTTFSKWLHAFDQLIHPPSEVALLSPNLNHPAYIALVDTVWSRFRPDLIAAQAPYPPPPGAPPLLQDRPLLDGAPTAYVCRGFVCQRPVTSPDELAAQLNQTS